MNIIRKIWEYGSKEPIQRIGIIILIIGLMSLFSWMYKRDLDLPDLFDAYYLPERRDFIFFHLYLYFIPLGLLMSWGYSLILKIKNWVFVKNTKTENLSNKQKNKPSELQNLYFKNNDAAFEFSSTMYSPLLESNKINFGIVRHVDIQKGSYCFVVELAGADNPLLVTGFNDKKFDSIHVGDLVYWGFVDTCEDNILNLKAVGHILATLNPEFTPSTRSWSIRKDLTK